MKTRACGAVHPDGVMCVMPVYYEAGCCMEQIYAHQEPHEHVNKDGRVTHRWEEVTKVMDLPFDAYSPRGSESSKTAATNARGELEKS